MRGRGGRARWWLPPVVLVAAALTAGTVLVWWVRVPAPAARADAVVVLGGDGERLAGGLALVRAGTAPLLLLSSGVTDGGCRQRGHRARGARVDPDRLPAVPAGVTVECFDPDPFTTRGEARALAALARDRGWRTLVVVTTDQQADRAWLRLRRCLPSGVATGISTVPHGQGLLGGTAYQLAGWAKALVTERGC